MLSRDVRDVSSVPTPLSCIPPFTFASVRHPHTAVQKGDRDLPARHDRDPAAWRCDAKPQHLHRTKRSGKPTNCHACDLGCPRCWVRGSAAAAAGGDGGLIGGGKEGEVARFDRCVIAMGLRGANLTCFACSQLSLILANMFKSVLAYLLSVAQRRHLHNILVSYIE